MDKAWDIQKEKHLNKSNIIFKDEIKYYKLYLKLLEVDNKIKQRGKKYEAQIKSKRKARFS